MFNPFTMEDNYKCKNCYDSFRCISCTECKCMTDCVNCNSCVNCRGSNRLEESDNCTLSKDGFRCGFNLLCFESVYLKDSRECLCCNDSKDLIRCISCERSKRCAYCIGCEDCEGLCFAIRCKGIKDNSFSLYDVIKMLNNDSDLLYEISKDVIYRVDNEIVSKEKFFKALKDYEQDREQLNRKIKDSLDSLKE